MSHAKRRIERELEVNERCCNAAEYTYQWPGRSNRIKTCLDHLHIAQQVASHWGEALDIEPYDDIPMTCQFVNRSGASNGTDPTPSVH